MQKYLSLWTWGSLNSLWSAHIWHALLVLIPGFGIAALTTRHLNLIHKLRSIIHVMQLASSCDILHTQFALSHSPILHQTVVASCLLCCRPTWPLALGTCCVFAKTVKLVDLTETRKTDCFGETRFVLHVLSSSWAGKQLYYCYC